MKLKKLLFLFVPVFAYGHMQDINTQVPSLPPKDATRSARTCHDLNGAYVTGDFLYWKARQDDLEYAAALNPAISLALVELNVVAFEIDFEYKPGFRVGLGGDLPWDGWDISLNWTRFSFDISSAIASNERQLVLLGGDVEELGFAGTGAKVSWDFTYNSLDFDWGRRLFLSSSFIIRPSIGLKAVWFDQKIKKRLEGVGTLPAIGSLAGLPAFSDVDFDIWGIGPYLSFYGKWNWIYGLGLAGQFSTSIFWYDIDEKLRAGSNFLQDAGQQVIVGQTRVSLKHHTHRLRPYVQAFLGLDWEWCFIPKWLSAQVSLGYEAHYFWSIIVDPINSNDDVNPSFEGLTLKARLDF